MARRSRQPRPKKKKLRLQLSDYQYPGEKMQYWQSVGIITGLFVWLAAMGFWVLRVWTYQWVYLAAWPIASVFVVNFMAARPRRRQLRKAGRQAKVMGSNYPQLYRLLTELSQVVGLRKPPEMYVLAEPSPYIYSLPGGVGTIILTKPLVELLSEEELVTLIAHELGHLKFHHLHLDLAMIYVDNVNLLLQFAFAPVTIWTRLMGAWRDVIDYTADRVTILLTHNSAALLRAMVKNAAAADAQAGLSQEEIEAYLASGGTLATDAAQMERYFKISEFVKNQPNMRDRIEEITQCSASEQAQAGWERIAQIRQELGLTHSAAG